VIKLANLLVAVLLGIATETQVKDRAPVIVEGGIGNAMDEYLSGCTRFGFSGSVLVARKGKILLQKGYGWADRSQKTQNAPDTLFEIASTSKQFTAAAILRLEQEGKLKISDPIHKHLPEVPDQHRGITLHHLLTHSSGLPRMGPMGGGSDLRGAVQGYLRAQRVAEPGRRFEYYNGGYALLAGIVELSSGRAFPSYCKERLFQPAGMASTVFCGDQAPLGSDLAHGYEDGKDAGPATAHSFGWEYRGMGGVVTSVVDLYRWDRALYGTSVLSRQSLKTLFTPNLSDYACGWWVKESSRKTRFVWHGGTVRGFESQLWRFLEEDAAIVVLANCRDAAYPIANNLAGLLFGAGYAFPPPPKTTSLTREALVALAGTYRFPSGEAQLVLRVEDDHLLAGAEGQEAVDRLTPGADNGNASRFRKECDLASKILSELARGDVSTLKMVMLPWIPSSWPETVRNILWPKHIQQWGSVQAVESLGALSTGSGRVRVVLALRHEKGRTAVEVVFQDGQLNILDLEGPEFPVQIRFLPISSNEFVTYEFTGIRSHRLRFQPGGVVLKPSSGREVTLQK
jgi:CubicO group peptidase (beta-lactamase class C family)